MDGPVWIIADENQPPWLLRRTKWSAQPERSGDSQPQAARRVSEAKQFPVRSSASGHGFGVPRKRFGLRELYLKRETGDFDAPHRGLCGPHFGWHIASGAWTPRETIFLPEVDEPLVLIGATLHANLPTTEWKDTLKTNGGLFRPGDLFHSFKASG
jgi:hypothetical protein